MRHILNESPGSMEQTLIDYSLFIKINVTTFPAVWELSFLFTLKIQYIQNASDFPVEASIKYSNNGTGNSPHDW